ncbi:MAG: hypothetical protein WDN45_15765 [Caulobacteraceae bacterium]
MNGQLNKTIGATFNTERDGDGNIVVLDGYARFEFKDEFNIWAGRMLPPTDRSNLDGPYYLSSYNYPGVVSQYPAKFAGRDDRDHRLGQGVRQEADLLGGRVQRPRPHRRRREPERPAADRRARRLQLLGCGGQPRLLYLQHLLRLGQCADPQPGGPVATGRRRHGGPAWRLHRLERRRPAGEEDPGRRGLHPGRRLLNNYDTRRGCWTWRRTSPARDPPTTSAESPRAMPT